MVIIFFIGLSFSQVAAKLFDIMSGQSEVDHPLCEECTDSLLNQLDEQLHIAEMELHDYIHFLEHGGKVEEKEDEEKALDEELEKLREEEISLLKQLETLEKQQEKIRIENEKLDKAEEKLKKDEEKYWKDYCLHRKALSDFQDEQIRLKFFFIFFHFQHQQIKFTFVVFVRL